MARAGCRLIRFHALGGLSVTDEGDELRIGGPRQRRLLAMLLIHRDTVVSVDRLADVVFEGEPTAAASTTLRSYVARTRRLVDGAHSGPVVLTQAPGYLLKAPPDSFDVACFEQALAASASHLERGDEPAAAGALRRALGLWRGDAYAEFADEDWARTEAGRLEELRLVAHERLVEAELACGRAAELIPEIESLTRKHPLREEFRAQLMLALYRAGRQVDALRVFREYRALLVDELGVDPSPALGAIEQRVLRHDPGLQLTEPAGRPLRGYRLGERLGTGRDGTVYAARVPGVDREFAIRVVREEIADRPEFVRVFEASTQRLAALSHPGIVPIHDYWREPGAAYLVMRRLAGGSLADRLEKGPLTDEALAALVTRVGGALAAAADCRHQPWPGRARQRPVRRRRRCLPRRLRVGTYRPPGACRRRRRARLRLDGGRLPGSRAGTGGVGADPSGGHGGTTHHVRAGPAARRRDHRGDARTASTPDRTPTRGCARSRKQMPATSSAATTSSTRWLTGCETMAVGAGWSWSSADPGAASPAWCGLVFCRGYAAATCPAPSGGSSRR